MNESLCYCLFAPFIQLFSVTVCPAQLPHKPTSVHIYRQCTDLRRPNCWGQFRLSVVLIGYLLPLDYCLSAFNHKCAIFRTRWQPQDSLCLLVWPVRTDTPLKDNTHTVFFRNNSPMVGCTKSKQCGSLSPRRKLWATHQQRDSLWWRSWVSPALLCFPCETKLILRMCELKMFLDCYWAFNWRTGPNSLNMQTQHKRVEPSCSESTALMTVDTVNITAEFSVFATSTCTTQWFYWYLIVGKLFL